MSDLELMRILGVVSAALAAPDADPETIERVLDSVPAQAGLRCSLRLAGGELQVEWSGAPTPSQEAFVDVLGRCVALALAVLERGATGVLDPSAFGSELERTVAAARWRGHQVAVAVFDVHGFALGPGIDESDVVAYVGAVARGAVRQDDVVGHLGAGRFALLIPRAGTFEARAAFKRVRDALAAGDRAADGLFCGAAGFAELETGHSSEDLLTAVYERLAEARRRSAYLGPTDPLHPMAG
jgi:GGDEF domain-containing protein